MTALNKDNKGVVLYRDEAGTFNLELATGRLYDLQGNQVAKWSPVENDTTRMLSDWVADEAERTMLHSLRTADPERADRAAQIMMSERMVKMDLSIEDVATTNFVPNMATGYRNEAPMADIVSPPVLVGTPAGKYYEFGREDAFQRALPTIGAAGAQVPEIAPRIAQKNFSTTEYALGGYVATQVEAAADAQLKIRQMTAKRIQTVLTLEREIRVANLFYAASAFDTSTTFNLASTFQWNGGSAADPVGDLQRAVDASYGGVSGIMMSKKLWNAFVRSAAVRTMLYGRSDVNAVPSVDQIRRQFDLPPIYIASMKYLNTAGVNDYVWGNSIVLFRQPDAMPPNTQDDVATSYTFRWNLSNIPDGVTVNGWTTREYYVQDRGSMGGTKIVLVHHDGETITSKYVGGIINGAWQ